VKEVAEAEGDRGDSEHSSPAKQLAKAETAGKPMGRPPGDEPDVFVEVPNLHVGKIEVDVERLEAHLALRTQVGNLLQLLAGVHIGVDKVKVDIEDVDASAELKVRLQNTYNILDRTLTTIDENPEILMGVLETAGTAVDEVGEIGKEATKPGGAVSALTSGVGDTLGNLGKGLGDTLTNVTDKVNPKRRVTGSGGGAFKAKSRLAQSASKAKSRGAQSGANGRVAKAAAGLTAGGAIGVLGGVLYRTTRRPRVLGVPVGRRSGLERVAKQIAKIGSPVDGIP
jgi:hypothetical protein